MRHKQHCEKPSAVSDTKVVRGKSVKNNAYIFENGHLFTTSDADFTVRMRAYAMVFIAANGERLLIYVLRNNGVSRVTRCAPGLG
jgi:hypothetical protein